MSNNSRESAVEKVIIRLLQTHARLKPMSIVSEESAARAQARRIIVKAEEGEKRLDGPRGFNYKLTITHGSGIDKGNQAKLSAFDMDIAAIEEQMEMIFGTSRVAAPVEVQQYAGSLGFTYFEAVEDQSKDKSEAPKSRKRSLNYNLHCAKN